MDLPDINGSFESREKKKNVGKRITSHEINEAINYYSKF